MHIMINEQQNNKPDGKTQTLTLKQEQDNVLYPSWKHHLLSLYKVQKKRLKIPKE
jgi:hypothetical protein